MIQMSILFVFLYHSGASGQRDFLNESEAGMFQPTGA